MKRSLLRQCVQKALARHDPSHPCWHGRAVHYSFVVLDNHILEMGTNRAKVSAPKHYGYPSFSCIHAEVDAWRKARGLLKGEEFEMVNIKLSRYQPYAFRISAPCKVCEEFIKSRGCVCVYYTTNEGKFNIRNLI